MNRQLLESIFAALFVVALIPLARDAQLSPGDPSRWLSEPVRNLAAVQLLVSAAGYVLVRKVRRKGS